MNKSFYILFILAAILIAESCKNNDEVLPVVTTTNLNVVNASADTLNFYLNGTRQNNTSSLFPGGQTAYLPEPSGQQNYQFKKAGTFNVLFSVPLTLQASTLLAPVYNSFYVSGTSANDAFTTQDILLQDTVANSTQIKFVNASPTSGSLDFYVGDTVNYKSLAFKGATQYFSTGGGIKQVQIYQSGITTPIIDTPITFQPTYIYTIYTRGTIGGKGTAAFNIGLLLNSTDGG